MGYCLASPRRGHGEHRDSVWMKRFDPRFWTVDFPRPMMGCVVSTAHDALRVELAFTGKDNLAGLIWEAEDRWDHPLLAYETARDFRRCRLRFRWRSSGVKPIDVVHGPVLTIEGRDESGAARTWYVRLWNYAVGTGADAVVSIDFGAVDGGFLLPIEADAVWAGDVDRVFISLVPPDYDGAAGDYAAMVDAWVELSEIVCEGSGSVLALGDAMLPAHGRSLASGYDDNYNLTPARLVRQVERLGYRGPLLHYVGMSHYARLTRSGVEWRASVVGGALCGPSASWHAALADEVKAQGWHVIWSLSYELFASYCPPEWMQRAADGSSALTGWVPPSALLSPANSAAMGYLQLVARAFARIALDAGMPVHFQVGEPWWWVRSDRTICLYDAAAVAALAAMGVPAVPIFDLGLTPSKPQRNMLNAAGTLLAQSTAALVAAADDEAGGGATSYLLLYLPSLLDAAMPTVRLANMPAAWARPAFDVLQLEDYDWAARGQVGLSVAGIAMAEARLGYPVGEQHYLSGFVLNAADRAQWAGIDAAAARSQARGVAATFVWALPQVARDGFTYWQDGEDAVQPFDDVAFPIALGREASVLAEFSTMIVTAQSGAEQRSPDWESARLRYDAGPGVRSEADVRALVDFYRARRGPGIAFRFRDPIDWEARVGGELLGVGDGARTEFALVKRYGDGVDAPVRRITRPVAASVSVTVNGVAASGWTLLPLGVVSFAVPPAVGAEVRAGFLFDVPVRFAEDRLEVSRATFLAGEVASVPLVEVREGGA